MSISFLLSSPPLSKPFISPFSIKALIKNPSSLKPIVNSPTARPTTIKICASYNPIPSTDRLISSLSYALPFVNSIPYSRFLLPHFPYLLPSLLSPFLPLLSLLQSLPFAGFIAFFALYLGVVRNPAFSRFVRFNAMQAVVLDVLLALPSLLHRMFGMPVGGIGYKIMEFGYNGIFLFAAGCFVYGVVSCVLGRMPYLPVVATAADRQL